MTFTHLMNCVALTYGPIYTIYSGSNLGEHTTFKFFSWSILYYLISALVKMVLYATIIPFNTLEADSTQDISQETIKVLITAIELLFIYYSLKVRNPFQSSESHLKVLTVGLSWAIAESVTSYLLYFLMNATGEEFKWEYIQTAIQSNLDTIERIAIVALVECYEHLRKSDGVNLHIVLILLSKYFLSGFGFKFLERLYSEDTWSQLYTKAIYVAIFSIISKIIYRKVFSEFQSEDAKLEAEANKAYENELRKKRS